MGITLILTGVACIVGAIIGGGVKLLQVEMRVVESRWRQYLLGAFGGALILGGLLTNGSLSFPSRNAEAHGVDTAKAEPTPTPPGADGNASASGVAGPADKPDAAPPSESPPEKKSAEAAPAVLPAIPSADTLLAGLRLHVGEATGTIGDRQVHRVAIWLELPERQRRAISAVRYEFYNPTFKSPKYAEQGSETFRARWQGYGCIQDAAIVASTASGEVRAPFDLCTLWREGRLGSDEKS